MKIDKTKLLQDIEAMKEKLASMEKELNNPETFKHFPSKGDNYYFYTSSKGVICSNIATSDDLRVNVFKSKEEANKAYNKVIALEKVKRRIIELQGDWKPNWSDTSNKYTIIYNFTSIKRFVAVVWQKTKYATLIPDIKTKDIAETIINEMENELKVIFDI